MVEAKYAVSDVYVIVGENAAAMCGIPVLDDEAVNEHVVGVGFGGYFDCSPLVIAVQDTGMRFEIP